MPKELRSKLNPKSHKCIFVGYGAEGEMRYYPESNKVIRSSNVIFNESQMHKQPTKEVEYRRVTFEDVETAPTLGASDVPSISVAPERAKSSGQVLRRSSRVSHPPDRFQSGIDYIMLIDCGEPTCFQEASKKL